MTDFGCGGPSRLRRWAIARWEHQASRSPWLHPYRETTMGQATGQVLEIGIGNGRSIPYYGRITALVALEPDARMIDYLRRRATAPFPIDVMAAEAGHLPFHDGSFDTVVSALVQCTVPDPGATLAEVRRVLRPGGQFRFFEHVRGGGMEGALHDALTPLWSRAPGLGCQLNRRIEDSVRAAGFRSVEIRHARLVGLPAITGVAEL